MTANLAYLKLINVPTMFDVGCSQADPSSDSLVLNIIDDKSFKVEFQEFLSKVRKFKLSKNDKFKSSLKAIHTNLLVSETTIWPVDVKTQDTTKPTGFMSGLFGPKADTQQSENRGENGGLESDKKLNIPIFIDGREYNEEASKIVVKRYIKDNVHVTVPIVTFLPLRMDDLPNSKF